MAKRFVQISLATKLRVLFGLAVLGIIAAALVVPWYFVELLAEQGMQRPAAELTRLRLNEWVREHHRNPAAPSEVAKLYSAGEQVEGRAGPLFVRVGGEAPAELDAPARMAMEAFYRDVDKELAVIRDDERGSDLYHCYRAVRMQPICLQCHRQGVPLRVQFQPGELVGLIEMTIPDLARADPLVWWTRGAFVAGGALAALLAIIMFSIITQRLILRPVRHLRGVSDKVADGDLAVRSTIDTGDELQTLGESLNEMLEAIGDEREKLRSANRALDLKLNELAEANVALFQANKVKSEFLANISHELRTPLNSIMGFADLIVASEDEKVARYGRNISEAARNLMRLITELLDLARIEAGRAEVRVDKVAVNDLCQTLVALMKPQADKKQQQLEGKLDDDVPLIETDGGKLQQILYNLLSNAVKFTPVGGRVTLSTAPAGRRDGKPTESVAIGVADTGPGISQADQQHIFDQFYQADRGLTRESAGVGLGLAIARELAELLGGRLALESSPGQGAEFTVFLPDHPPADAGKTRQQAPSGE